MKGYRDFDVEQAYAAMRKSATESTMLPWSRGPLTGLDRVYFEKGFFPALANGEQETVQEVTPERRQAVSVTLESSYDDWCLAQFAKALGKQSDEVYFNKLAHNYENVFNPEIGFMAPKSADGEWVAHFDPNIRWRTRWARLHDGGRFVALHVQCAARRCGFDSSAWRTRCVQRKARSPVR